MIKEMIETLREIERENWEWHDRETTITHGHYCIEQSFVKVDEDRKVIKIVCDSDTGFGRNMNNDIYHLILVIKYFLEIIFGGVYHGKKRFSK